MDTPTTAEAAFSNALTTTGQGQGTRESEKPTVVGLYGVPSSGKSFMMNYLKKHESFNYLAFYEGLEVIDSLVPGGLEAFKALGEQRKAAWRARAIEKIKKDTLEKDTMAVTTAHFMHWPEEQAVGQPVYAVNDFHVFTHIIYLNTPAECIFQRHLQEKHRDRPVVSVAHLRKWQEAEMVGLRHVCFQSGILFHVLTDPESLCERAEIVVNYFWDTRTQENNDHSVTKRLDKELRYWGREQLETALVLDADSTFTSSDTNSLLSNAIDRVLPRSTSTDKLNELLDGSLDFSHTTLLQTTLLLEEVADDDQYHDLCEAVASCIEVNPGVVSLLRAAGKHPHIFVVVVTQGLEFVWRKVLIREGLYNNTKVLGSEGISGCTGFVISPITKGKIVHHLCENLNLYVWAFGQGLMDFMMLKEANEAVILVGDEQDGNPSTKLISAMESLESCNINKIMMPAVRLGDPAFVKSVARHRFEMVHATEKGAAKLLLFSICNASTGRMLRDVYQNIGVYLALEYVSELVGLEEHPMTGEQSQQLRDYRLRDEQQTSIVAITSGGEPMACAINGTFPRTMLICGVSVSDINHRLQHQRTVILVNSDIDNGQTMMEFLEKIRKSHRQIRIVVVAGVVNAKVTERDHDLNKTMRRSGASLVALTVLEDDFTGTESTDTYNLLLTARPEMDLS